MQHMMIMLPVYSLSLQAIQELLAHLRYLQSLPLEVDLFLALEELGDGYHRQVLKLVFKVKGFVVLIFYYFSLVLSDCHKMGGSEIRSTIKPNIYDSFQLDRLPWSGEQLRVSPSQQESLI